MNVNDIIFIIRIICEEKLKNAQNLIQSDLDLLIWGEINLNLNLSGVLIPLEMLRFSLKLRMEYIIFFSLQLR